MPAWWWWWWWLPFFFSAFASPDSGLRSGGDRESSRLGRLESWRLNTRAHIRNSDESLSTFVREQFRLIGHVSENPLLEAKQSA